MNFDNTYSRLPAQFYAHTTPASFPDPQLILFNEDLANDLGLDLKKYSAKELALIFSGQKALEGSHFLSLAYAGHQFGHFVPMLGDGRAILLGEVKNKNLQRFDVQLKGPGRTPFSRNGDGKSSLGPVIREYLVSEAMHALGVPTTRALAAVLTGESVFREEELPGAVFTRVASSHIRIGTFEYFSARNDLENLALLLDYSLLRHYPEASQASKASGDNKALTFLNCVIESQTSLVAQWMGLGFIHGVMNTDNTSVSGQTIDFGPCAFMDYFDFEQVYSYIDRHGRYAYNNQPTILAWNLSRLASCLIPLVDADKNKSVERLQEKLNLVPGLLEEKITAVMCKKLGLTQSNPHLVSQWLNYLHKEKIDFTLGFRNLSELVDGAKNTAHKFYRETSDYHNFLKAWHPLAKDKVQMNQVNPIYIPRNHQVERAIRQALGGDYSVFKEMNWLLKNPYQKQAGLEQYSLPPKEDEKICNTFCGT